jgi:hypothetical protein
MFGFGKKKLDDRLIGGIVVEVGMFQSWTLDRRGIDLNPIILEDIIKRILDREKTKYSNEEMGLIKMMAISNMEFEQMREFRKKTNFDGQVVGFCRSIGLPSEFCTPTR